MELKQIVDEYINEKLVQVILSNPINKETGSKIKIRPVYVKDTFFYQETLYKGTQVFHNNFKEDEIKDRVENNLLSLFRQGEIMTKENKVTILVSKNKKITIKINKNTDTKEVDYSHNREKQYILKEGTIIDFLVGLGVQTKEGKIAKNKFDKFRQINRYLEFIEDIIDALPQNKKIQVVDFGCGKSYLTFAMYYYLHEIKKYNVSIIGLDLKKEVIKNCNKLALECNYNNLHFEVGDISSYQSENQIDMVVSLHACDKATDYAIEKAIKWQASVIMAVPCCQHEINQQIESKELKPILKYGIIKERIAALVTDAIRANLLEEQGYDTQILEFIDLEHTPKNLLIRAVRNKTQMKKKNTIYETIDFLHVDPTLKKLLDS